MKEPLFSPTALSVLEKRYLLKDSAGEVIETPVQLFQRVAYAIGNTDEQREQYYNMMASFDFLPNSPTLMNAGTELGMLSACFVVPIGDSIEEIFDGIKHAAMIHKAGGGVGYSFSNLRPTNDIVASTHGVSSGPISFMSVYDAATETIKQGGRRRGANMGILMVNHPDIETFITCKNDLVSLTNFNISVGITEEFMQAVEEDSSFPLINPKSGEIVKHVSAKELFSAIGENAYLSGEPGVVFIDAINAANPTPHLGKIESTNPCGEQPLLPYESCNLGSINLGNFVDKGKMDHERLEETIRHAVQFLDQVIDCNCYPLEEIRNATYRTRKIGLGVMGWADMLIKMGIPYASRRALNAAETLMKFFKDIADSESHKLAHEFGPYPGRKLGDDENFYRNATRTTIAPTGTISIIAGASSGVEPLFALAFKRRILGGEEFQEIHPLVEQVIRPHLSRYKWEKFQDTVYERGKIDQDCIERFSLGEFINPELFVIAHDIPWEWHLKMQAAFQKFTDNAVSKTINLPKDISVKEIEKIYKQAWKLGLKGVTVYRDGSRKGQTLSTGKADKEPAKKITPRERPDVTQGIAQMIQTGCGKMFVIPCQDDQGVCETFINLGKGGACAAANLEATGRLISLALRSGIGMEEVIKQLSGIRCPNPVWNKGKQILSCADGIAKVLAELEGIKLEPVDLTPVVCPECGSSITPEGGCESCYNCGWSKCK